MKQTEKISENKSYTAVSGGGMDDEKKYGNV